MSTLHLVSEAFTECKSHNTAIPTRLYLAQGSIYSSHACEIRPQQRLLLGHPRGEAAGADQWPRPPAAAAAAGRPLGVAEEEGGRFTE